MQESSGTNLQDDEAEFVEGSEGFGAYKSAAKAEYKAWKNNARKEYDAVKKKYKGEYHNVKKAVKKAVTDAKNRWQNSLTEAKHSMQKEVKSADSSVPTFEGDELYTAETDREEEYDDENERPELLQGVNSFTTRSLVKDAAMLAAKKALKAGVKKAEAKLPKTVGAKPTAAAPAAAPAAPAVAPVATVPTDANGNVSPVTDSVDTNPSLVRRRYTKIRRRTKG